MTDEKLDEKLESLTEEEIEDLEGDELHELVERVYGDDDADGEDDEPATPQQQLRVQRLVGSRMSR